MYTKEPIIAITQLHSYIKTHKSNIIIITSAMSLAPSAIEEGLAFHVPLVAYRPMVSLFPNYV